MQDPWASEVGGAPRFAPLPEAADFEQIARHTGTPAYVLFEQRLRDNYQRLQAALADAEPVRIYYSVKSNYETPVLATLRALGCGAEISGDVESLAVERAGFAWDRVIFDGPVKNLRDVEAAVRNGIHLINIESESELECLRRLARGAGRPIRVGVRVDAGNRPPLYDVLIRTYRQKFGFTPDRALALAAAGALGADCVWSGLMAHAGSQITRAEPFLQTMERLFALASLLAAAGVTIDEINIGGGLPASGMRNLRLPRRARLARLGERLGLQQVRTEPSERIAARIAARAVELRRQHRSRATLAIEPGRALVSDACVLLGRVQSVNPPWMFTDIGINDLPEKLSLSEWRMAFPGTLAPPVHRGHLAGPTLATQDVLAYDHRLPPLRVGDLVAVFDTGAYSIARASQFTRPRPPVFCVDREGRLHLVRRAETAADVLALQRPPGGDAGGGRPDPCATR